MVKGLKVAGPMCRLPNEGLRRGDPSETLLLIGVDRRRR
jgi:hypothetical protein